MDIKNFFKFGSKLVSSSIYAPPQGLRIPIKDDIDDAYNLIKGDYSGINFPVVFKEGSYGGKKIQDIIDTTSVSLYLISDKLKNILIENSFTGWKIYPVRLFDRKENEIMGYSGFSVTGRCDVKIKYRKDSIVEKQLAPNAPISRFYKGQNIDFTKWDGSDFFITKDNIGFIITEKVKEILLKHKLTNIRVRNIKDIEVSDFNIKEEDLI